MTGLRVRVLSVVAGSVAVLAATALAGCGSSASATPNRPASSVVQPTSPLAQCPTGFVPPATTGNDELVTATPNSAVLCTYALNGDTVSLTKAQPLEHGIADLVRYLNALPTAGDSAGANACLLAATPQFTIVFGYPSGATTEVSIDVSCGRAGRSDAVRRLTSLSTILGYWR